MWFECFGIKYKQAYFCLLFEVYKMDGIVEMWDLHLQMLLTDDLPVYVFVGIQVL